MNAPALHPHRYVGRYELLSRIGVGGMGEVWVARYETLGGVWKAVALKLLNQAHAGKDNYRAMFLAEARLTTKLHHPNIVQVLDAGETREGMLYMVMDWIEGCDLSTLNQALWDRGERIPPAAIGHIIAGMLRALSYAHEDGSGRDPIIHRDVSPQNVMLSVHGEVKLMDFGIARLASEDTSGIHVKGKLRYMSPDQIIGSSRYPKVDLFAVGAVLHELLDGRRFRAEAEDVERLQMMAMLGQFSPLRPGPTPLDPALERVHASLLRAEGCAPVNSAAQALAMLGDAGGAASAQVLAGLVRAQVEPAMRLRITSAVASTPSIEEPRPQAETTLDPQRSTTGVSGPQSVNAGTHPGSALAQDRVMSSERDALAPRRWLGVQVQPRSSLVVGLACLALGLSAAALHERELDAQALEPRPVEPARTEPSEPAPVEVSGPARLDEPEVAAPSAAQPEQRDQRQPAQPSEEQRAPAPSEAKPEQLERSAKLIINPGLRDTLRCRVGPRSWTEIAVPRRFELAPGRHRVVCEFASSKDKAARTLELEPGRCHELRGRRSLSGTELALDRCQK